MASINKATIIGFVGQEPKVDTLQTGTKVTQFSVATTEKGYTTQGGTTVSDRTEWHNIVLWGKLAEIAGQYLHKGSSVYIEGKIRTRSYDDRNGIKRYVTEIHGDIMQMLDRRQDNGQPQPQQNTYSGGGSSQGADDDDLPF
jgi:single-strand DNA-binding protein